MLLVTNERGDELLGALERVVEQDHVLARAAPGGERLARQGERCAVRMHADLQSGRQRAQPSRDAEAVHHSSPQVDVDHRDVDPARLHGGFRVVRAIGRLKGDAAALPLLFREEVLHDFLVHGVVVNEQYAEAGVRSQLAEALFYAQRDGVGMSVGDRGG